MTPAEYQTRVEQACDFLRGKSREWLKEIKAEMKIAAAKLQLRRQQNYATYIKHLSEL